ncbi:Receptor expression-enhancing protein 5 [Bonamia ostreae]|uniref:Receptor expression-enhancing protein 5 n=1 Tax=Bonamia ostreae TaxID=126728 RepID=A0ABV2AM50_9EUKA
MKFFKRSKKKKKNSASEYFSDNDSEKSVSLKKRLSNIFKTKKPEKSSSFAQNPPSKQPKTTITSFQTKNTPSESTTERNHSHFHPNPAKIDFNQINSDENPFLRKPSSPNHDIANRKNLANLDSDKTKQNLANLNKTKFGQNIETLNFLNSLSKHYKWSVLVARKAKTGDTRSIVIICSFLSCILIFMGCLQPFIHALSACAYPAYMSFKALKTETQEDDRKWLVYWTVYGIIRITESF